MATTKKSSKAKTKTATAKTSTKVTKTKAAKARSAAKTTAKRPVATAKVKRTAAVPVTKATGLNVLRLRRVLMLSIFVFAALAALAGFMMKSTTYELTTTYQTSDVLASDRATEAAGHGVTVFGSATHVVTDVELRWLVVGLMIFSVILPVLYLSKWEKNYSDGLKKRVMPWRWLEMAVTSAIVLEVIALLSGIQDLITLKMIGGLMVVTCLLGWLAERQNQETSSPVWSAYATSLVTGALPWVAIAIVAIATPLYGQVHAPWFVYSLYAAGLIGGGLFAVNQFKQIKNAQTASSYANVERRYLLTSLAMKLAFAGLIIVGFKK